jgi:CO/xanthine dehydrogenase Mo-binding subunit
LVPLLRGGIHYIHDLVLPGLIHGCVLHRPGQGGEGADLDATARRLDPVRGMPGVVGVVADGGLLGVLADGAGRAERAARRLESLLEVRAGVPAPDQGHVHHADVAHATPQIGKHGAGADPTDPESWAQGDWPARIVASLPALPDGGEASAQGSAPLQAPEGGRLVQAVFTRGWLAHASIGPSCAIARWTDDLSALDVWTHSQGIHNLRRDLALAWGLDEASVRVRHVPGAGCYGHNGADDVAFDACWLARHAAGRPARVTWLREQEWRSAPLGPAMRVAVQAALDAQGRIVAWHHRFWSPGHSSRPGRSATPSLFGNALRSGGAPLPEPIDMPLATGGGSERNAVPGYDWPSWQVVGHRVRVPWRASALRSLGAHANVYAAESLLDEVARLTDRCPWAIRLDALGHDARGAAVLRLARQRSDWDARRSALRGVEGAGLGLAYARYKNNGAWCAVVAEVRAEATLRVVRLTVVADVGLPIHPEGVAQQLEGGAVQAVSWTVKESVAADAAGDVALATWDDYPLLGFADMPQVDVHLVASSEPPLGAGETACGPTGAAIGNALFDALGVRVRNLPLTPERIVAAMAS